MQPRGYLVRILLLVIAVVGCGSDSCRSVFEQGVAEVTWRRNGPGMTPPQDADLCYVQWIDREQARHCLVSMKLAHKRNFEAVFIGDSRIRDFYGFVTGMLEATRDMSAAGNNCFERFNRTYKAGEEPHGRDHWCSYLQHGDHVAMTYLWRPMLDAKFQESVRQLTDRCLQPANSGCPHLVVLNSGLHYIWNNFGRRAVLGVQQFHRQLAQAAPLLQQLTASGVTVVWMLNEPLMEDAGGGLMVMHTEIAWLINQTILSVMRRYPGVIVWTSNLPVTMWYQEACRMLGYPENAAYNCRDPIHVGNAVHENNFDVLFNFVCHRHVDLPRSNCCAGRS